MRERSAGRLAPAGRGFWVSTHHDPPPRPTLTLEEVQRDQQAFVAGFAETEHSIHFDPELARRQRELLGEPDG